MGGERAIVCQKESSSGWRHKSKGSSRSVVLLELVSQAIGIDVELSHQRQPVIGNAVVLVPFYVSDRDSSQFFQSLLDFHLEILFGIQDVQGCQLF